MFVCLYLIIVKSGKFWGERYSKMLLWVQKGLDFERSHFHRTLVYGRDNSKRALESPLNRGDEAL